MPLLPDSGEPGDIHEQLGIGEQKPDLLTEATWAEINAEFQLHGSKGRGGQAVVFQAKERNSPHRGVALKVYHENTETARQQFENECRILASDRLPPEVVGYYRCVGGQGQRQPYLVLEFIDGTTLAKLATSSKQPLTFDVKVDLIEQLGRSFQRLHECNLIFGDGSANNILVETDYRLRFVDLAGAKELIKGHGRTRSSINLVTPGFFAQTDADAAVAKEVRTNLASDLYAMSANAFLLLTGRSEDQCRSVGSRNAEREWNQALVHARVPRDLRAIVLKGLRVPDPLKSNDPRLYPTAAAFANDVAGWKRSTERRRHGLLVAALLLIVALPGAFGWFKWNEARQASDLVASRRMISELQQDVGKLVPHAAVERLRNEASAALQQLDDAQARGEPLAKSLKLADDARSALRHAVEVGREIGNATELRTAIGSILLEDRSPVASEFWTIDAPTVRKRLTALQARYNGLGKRIETGEVGAAETSLLTELTKLLADLKQLVIDNGNARTALQAKREYEREKRSVSERIQKLGEFTQIDKTAQRGEQGFEAGQFTEAKANFGNATNSLTEYLHRPGIETSEEKQNRQRVTVDLVKVLESDKTQLQSRVAQLNGDVEAKLKQVSDLQTSLAAINDKLKGKDADIAKEKSRADSLSNEKTKLTEQVTALTNEKQSLNNQIKSEQDAAKKQLAEMHRLKNRAEDAEKLLAGMSKKTETTDSVPRSATKPLAPAETGNGDNKDPLPKLPERLRQGLKLVDEVIADKHQEGPVPDKTWILVREADDGLKILSGPTAAGLATRYDKPFIDENGVFEIELTQMIGEGFQPVVVAISEREFNNRIGFSYSHRGPDITRPNPSVELFGRDFKSAYSTASDAGWKLRDKNVITFVVSPKSVSAYINGKFFSAAPRASDRAFYEYEIKYMPDGMGATYVRLWK